MTIKNGNGVKATATNAGNGAATMKESEAYFNDTIARNRAIALLDLAAVPHVPTEYKPTDPVERTRRFRWLSTDLRAEATLALREAAQHDLKAELGRFAPAPERATAIADRVDHTGEMVARAETLLAYAREVDQIAMSDALMFLEAEQKQYVNAVQEEPGLVKNYRALARLFEMRSGAIAEGIARAKASGDAAAPAVEGAVAAPGK